MHVQADHEDHTTIERLVKKGTTNMTIRKLTAEEVQALNLQTEVYHWEQEAATVAVGDVIELPNPKGNAHQHTRFRHFFTALRNRTPALHANRVKLVEDDKRLIYHITEARPR